MPPRYRKRKSNRFRSRSNKRRRVGSRGRYRGRRGSTAKRSYKLRRFKHKYRSRRRKSKYSSKKGDSKNRNALEFRLAVTRTAQYEYGQQHTVPNADTAMECVYFMTEKFDNTITNRGDVGTRALGGITDILNIADNVWQTTPTNAATTTNPGFLDSSFGSLFLRGRDIYMLRNQVNEHIMGTAFYCVAKRDYIFNPEQSGKTVTMYDYLGSGWAQNGLDISNSDGNNGTMFQLRYTPFDSRLFTRIFKIAKVEKFRIPIQGTKTFSIGMKWHRYDPNNYVRTTNSGLWATRDRRFDVIKGERFILFKVHSNVGGDITSNTAFQKEVAQTTPTVAMVTRRSYEVKHIVHPQNMAINFVSSGISTDTASIIIDVDDIKGGIVAAS